MTHRPPRTEPKRREDIRFLTGQGSYTGDLRGRRWLHAVARPVAIRPRAAVMQVHVAHASPQPAGVVAVFTAADLAADGVAGHAPGGVDLPRSNGEPSPRTGPAAARPRPRASCG